MIVGLLLLHFLIESTGHHYLYRTVANTLLRGQLGPDIFEYQRTPNRFIYNDRPQPWPLAAAYGHRKLEKSSLDYHQTFESVAFLVIHRDSILFEQYWDDFGPDSIANSFSMAKSMVALLTGIAIDKGLIENVDQPLYEFMPQYREGVGADVTIKHLLTMSSGFNFDEHYINPFAFPAKANYTDDLEVLLNDYQPTHPPGKFFHYQSGTTQLLGQLLVNQSKTSLSSLASQWVWKPLGAERSALWGLDDKDGMEKAFCCINATARDFGRIGKLYKDFGRWNGQTIVDSAFIAESIQPPSTLNKDGTPCNTYGYQWWLSVNPDDPFFFMRGIKGQYVLVDPLHDLIVVRLGRIRDDGNGDRPHPNDVYQYLEMGRTLITQ